MDLAEIIRRAKERARGAVDRLRGTIDRLRGVAPSSAADAAGRVLSRVRSLWSNNVLSTITTAQTFNRVDPWYQWQLGATEKHCQDCLALHGQIHRASDWRASGIKPQSSSLECGGWNCDCKLVEVPDYAGDGQGQLAYWQSGVTVETQVRVID